MGRRALPKIKTDLDLSSHLVTWGDPSCSDQLVPIISAPNLEIEVGCGKGLYLCQAGPARPTHTFLGIEVVGKYARHSAARLCKRDISNVTILHGDAMRMFREVVRDNSVSAIHVYFPDPWWKKKHRRRRVMNEEFLKDVWRTLVPGGRLHFWTDVEEYFQTTLQLITQQSLLEGPFDVPVQPAIHDLDYRTHFERRVRLNDLPRLSKRIRKARMAR